MIRPRCAWCPRDPAAVWCVSARNPAYCDHARAEAAGGAPSGTYYTATIRAEEPTAAERAALGLAAAVAEVVPGPAPTPCPEDAPSPTEAGPEPPALLPLAEVLDCLKRARRCRYRSRITCQSATCVHPSRRDDPMRARVGLSDCRDCVRDGLGWRAAPTVSVIVAARNYGRYLAAALRSAWEQTVRPLEVIYADDGSEDDSLAVARTVPQVVILPSPGGHRGVCDARNRGLAVARGDYVVHLDGDDLLAPDYLEARIAALGDADGAFVYGPAQAFGTTAVFWDTPEWDWSRLWVQNWCNTSTFYPADLIRRVGGWREGIGTAWDWDLAHRCGRVARGIRDRRGILHYRQHPASVSHVQDVRGGSPALARMNRLFRLSHARVRLACVLSGRVLGRFPAWLEAVRATLAHADRAAARARPFPPFGMFALPRPDLALLYTGPRRRRQEVLAHLRGVEWLFGDIQFQAEPWDPADPSEERRRWNVAEGLADRCNRLNAGPHDVTWFLEDDIEPPPNAYWDLLHALLADPGPRPATAGWYRNRHVPRQLVAHHVRAVGVETPETDLATDTDFDLTGTGCLMVFKPFASHSFGANGLGAPAHDWNWCRQVPGGVRVLAGVGCRHYLDETTHV